MSEGISNLDEQDMMAQENETVKIADSTKNQTLKKHKRKNKQSNEEKEIKIKLSLFTLFSILYVCAIFASTEWFDEVYVNYTNTYRIIVNSKNLFFFTLNCLREYYYSRDTKVNNLPIKDMMKSLFNSTDYTFDLMKVSILIQRRMHRNT